MNECVCMIWICTLFALTWMKISSYILPNAIHQNTVQYIENCSARECEFSTFGSFGCLSVFSSLFVCVCCCVAVSWFLCSQQLHFSNCRKLHFEEKQHNCGYGDVNALASTVAVDFSRLFVFLHSVSLSSKRDSETDTCDTFFCWNRVWGWKNLRSLQNRIKILHVMKSARVHEHCCSTERCNAGPWCWPHELCGLQNGHTQLCSNWAGEWYRWLNLCCSSSTNGWLSWILMKHSFLLYAQRTSCGWRRHARLHSKCIAEWEGLNEGL